jgi:hypothetical protein
MLKDPTLSIPEISKALKDSSLTSIKSALYILGKKPEWIKLVKEEVTQVANGNCSDCADTAKGLLKMAQ